MHLTIMKTKIRLYKLIFIIGFFCFLVSCENDIEKINILTDINKMPVESIKEVTTIRSDSGKIQLYMVSPQLDRYQGEQAFTKFPKGLKVLFYDDFMNIKLMLSAKYAVNYEDRKILELQNNVVIVDYKKGDTIYTESMIWNQDLKKISSDVLVKRINKDGVLYGEGFDADENFNEYTLRRPRGTITVDNE